MYLTFTDEALMELLKKDDQLALKTLFNRYYKSLCQYCAVYTNTVEAAEEIIADLFIRLWDNRHAIKILSLKAYLFVSAKNMSLNFNLKKKLPLDLLEDLELREPVIAEFNTPFKIMSGRESYNHIIGLINTLPAAQRQVLLMSRIDNLNKQEISKILNISVRTVETNLYQAIKKLRSLLPDVPNYIAGA